MDKLDDLVGTHTIEAALIDTLDGYIVDAVDLVVDDQWFRFREGRNGWCQVERQSTSAAPDQSWRIAPIVCEFRIRQTPQQRMLYAIRESDGLVVFVAGTVNTDHVSRPSNQWTLDGGPIRDRDGNIPRWRHTRILWIPDGFTPKWLHEATEASVT